MGILKRIGDFLNSGLFVFIAIVVLLAWSYYDKIREENAYSDPEKLTIVVGRVTLKYRNKKSNSDCYNYSFFADGIRFEKSSFINEDYYELGDNLYVKYNIEDPNYSKPLTIEEMNQRNLMFPSANTK